VRPSTADETEPRSTATATPGSRSQFDVFAHSRLIFSKQDESRFPEADEVVQLL
jgi:predicted Rdx family selenoprotein